MTGAVVESPSVESTQATHLSDDGNHSSSSCSVDSECSQELISQNSMRLSASRKKNVLDKPMSGRQNISKRGSYTKAKTKAEKVRDAGMIYSERKSAEFFNGSMINDNLDDLPTFDKEQIELGKKLGKGRFGIVYEVTNVRIDNQPTDEKWICEERQFIHDHVKRESGESKGDARYAIKVLSPDVIKDSGLFIQGIYDMSIETRILCDIEHTNIIRARAIANVSPFHGDKFYIMMDRLYDTLGKRIQKWAKKQKRRSSLIGRTVLKDKSVKKHNEDHLKKLVSAYDLSDALGYLHKHGIIYRDLKPENIGFDIRDDIKLFDFGLATEMKPSRLADPNDERCDVYKMTGMTGSPRYMSNEVANEQNYNEKCDVYSFAILLWEMLTTKSSFQMYDMSMLRDNVWNSNVAERPPIDDDEKCWTPNIQSLVKEMWNPNFRDRPSFESVTETLRHEIVTLRGGDDSGLDLQHSQRRSTFVFDKDNFREQLMKQLSVQDIDQ